MSLNIFAKVAPLLRDAKFDINVDDIITFLEKYKSGQWIYPSAVHRATNIDIKLIYDILEICSDNKIVEPYLEIYCPICNKYTKEYYKVISDIPPTLNCYQCDAEIRNPVNHAFVIYKVI